MFLDHMRPSYTNDERSQRKELALRLLKDPFFQSVMEEAENEAIEAWMISSDPASRERAWAIHKGLEVVNLTLQRIVGDAPLDTSS